jgi:multiple antibiotic resistance protein
MIEHWSEYTRFAISLFALLNPFTKLSYVLSVTSRVGGKAVIVLAISATSTMICVLLTMHFVGESFLVTMGTSLPSFQIGGGLIILLSGLSMLNESHEDQDDDKTIAHHNDISDFIKLGVAPLGIPMLAGAGAITKVVIETHPGHGIDNEFFITAIIIVECLLAGVILASSSVLKRFLGAAFLSVISRVAGIIIVAVAIEIMVKGVFAHVKIFAAG